MNNDLISKKDLLSLTGISYGQLYRWKRKNLIPEDWFIRKSTFTGQETFFPREKVLERVNKIQSMKDNLSLDELANMFSPNVKQLSLSIKPLLEHNIVSETSMEFYLSQVTTDLNTLNFEQVLHIYIFEKLLQSGDIHLDEGKMLLNLLTEHHQDGLNSELIVIRKLGISTCFLCANGEGIHLESGAKMVARLSILAVSEELKTKLF